MPVTVGHVLTATTPDDPAWEIRPSHWNSNHIATISAVGSEIVGAFTNAGNVSFGLDGGGFISASANVTAAPSPVNVTGANGSSVNAQTIAFSNVNGITLGVSTAANGATVTGSYTVPTVPTAYVSSVNGSSGAISLNVGSSLSASTNGSSITFGLASNITTALQSAGAYLTTAALSNHSHGFSAAGGSSTFQTLSFSNGGGVSFTNSNGQVAATVATTYAASNHSHGNPQLNLTNLSGTTASNSAGFTLSLSANAPGAESNAINLLGANTAGNTTATGSTIGWSGVNVTLSGTNNSQIVISGPGVSSLSATGAVSISVNADTISIGVPQFSFYASSNTTAQSSSSSFSHGSLTFRGAGGVSVGFSGSEIVISGGAGGAGDGGIFISAAGSSQSAGNIVLSNSNGLAFGMNGSTITGSYTVPTVTNSSWTVSDNATSATVGRLAFTQANGITMSLSTSNNGNHTVFASHNGLTSQSNQNALAANGNFNFQTLSFSNAQGVSFATSAGSAIVASVETSYAASNHSHGNPTLALTNLSGTTASNSAGFTLSLSAGAGGAGDGVNILAAGTRTATTAGTVLFETGNGITFGLNAVNGSVMTASHNALTSQSNQNVTAGNGGFAFQTLSFSNANGISFGTSAGSAITASHNAITTARASTDAIGLNTAQSNVTWTVNSSGLSLDARGYAGTATGFTGANISGTFTYNSVGLSMSLSVAAPGAAAENNAINLLGANTAGNTTATGSTIGWSGVNVTLSGTNNSQVVISAPATSSIVGVSGISISTAGSTISVQPATLSGWEPYRDNEMLAGQQGQATLHFNPIRLENVIQFDRAMIPIVNTNSSNSSGSHTLSFWAGLYTQNVSTLSLLASASRSVALTHSGTAGSYSLYSGQRHLSMGWTTTLSAGKYWVANITRTTSGGADGSYSQFVLSQVNSNFLGHFGSSHNTTYQVTLGQGVYTATTSGFPASVAFSQIRGSDSMARRAPVIMFMSGTV